MATIDKLIDIRDQTTALLTYANGITGAADTRLGDAVKTLADGYSASNMFFTPVSEIPVGRSFSIPCDYTKCIIIFYMVSAANIRCGFGYNGKIVNAGNIQWTTGDGGYSQILVDNNNFIISSTGFFDKSASAPSSSLYKPTERTLDIQPHWVNAATSVSGGYWTLILEE